jgi:hypothetical protein
MRASEFSGTNTPLGKGTIKRTVNKPKTLTDNFGGNNGKKTFQKIETKNKSQYSESATNFDDEKSRDNTFEIKLCSVIDDETKPVKREIKIDECTAGPRGREGPAGQQGPCGKDGEKGGNGFKGEEGPQGKVGDIGKDGVPGRNGSKGVTGADGKQGVEGPQGRRGESLRGPRGYDGKQGNTGKEGPQGNDGETGKTGPPGNTGKDGPKGKAGPYGGFGPEGKPGTRGLTGCDGKQGKEGPEGESGPCGIPGPTGPEGLFGKTGPQGPQGPEGKKGPPCECTTDKINNNNYKMARRIIIAGEYQLVDEEVVLIHAKTQCIINLPKLRENEQNEDNIGYSFQITIRCTPYGGVHTINCDPEDFINTSSKTYQISKGNLITLFSFGNIWYTN